MQNSNATTLSAAIWPVGSSPSSSFGRAATLIVAGVLLLTLSAQAKIPFYPVPVTLQTLVLLILGMAYGLRLASSTALCYLAVGATGVPVFAGGGGIPYMLGPTGGYLVGFVVAMALMGYMGDRGWGKSYRSMILPMVAGTVVIYLCGVLWLSHLIGLPKALAGGLYPFLLGDAAKIVVAVLLVPQAWKLTGRLKR